MSCSGWIARLMLVIALLPWGAYLGAGRGPSLMVPAATVAMIETSDSLRAVAPPGNGAVMASQPRRCKTGVPAGTTCAPDAMMAGVAQLGPPPGKRLGRTAQIHGFAAAPPDAPPRRPPRTA